MQVNAVPMPLGADNPHGVGWFGVETELETEGGAIREVDPRASRFWKIKNPRSRLPTTGAHSQPWCQRCSWGRLHTLNKL